jgi:hypothetical protein
VGLTEYGFNIESDTVYNMGHDWSTRQMPKPPAYPVNYAYVFGDDDGDGIINERDERDMIFTWVANHFTTRANVFDFDISVELADPPYYPGEKLPYAAYKTNRMYARKQVVGVLDRSATFRIDKRTGRCDFSGLVEPRLIRLTDDLKVY